MTLKDGRKVVGNRGPARSGATSTWCGEFRVRNCAPGCFWELSGSVSGSFRSSEIGSRSPLSDRFGGMFDFKAGRWHCGAHATAEDTESDETCSTLSTNALDVRYFFPGSAHVASGQEIRRPRRGVRGGLKGIPWRQDFACYISVQVAPALLHSVALLLFSRRGVQHNLPRGCQTQRKPQIEETTTTVPVAPCWVEG